MLVQREREVRVIHLSTSHTGGAGIAARRLNSRLSDYGVNSSFYSLARVGYEPGVNEFEIKRRLPVKLFGVLSVLISRVCSNLRFFSLMSSPAISLSSVREMCQGDKTILHIHNWFNLLSFRQIARLVNSGIPIVFTMHDQRLMTGGCHTAIGCEGFTKGCKPCPHSPGFINLLAGRNQRNALQVFGKTADNVAIISPSQFLQNESLRSYALARQKVTVIPNVLDNDFKKLRRRCIPRSDVREYRVGFAALNSLDLLKGGDLIEDLEQLIQESDIQIEIVKLSEFKSGHSDFWNYIDCLIVPSRGDNSPNVIHEAKSLGIPVIASKVGGITELLNSNVDILVELVNLNPEYLLQCIYRIIKREVNMQQIIGDYEKLTENALTDVVSLYKSFLIS